MKTIPINVFKGRGAVTNPQNRYERHGREQADDGWGNLEEAAAKPVTQVIEQTAKSIISHNTSPDIPFSQSINPYQGCEHGCIYCYARPSHAYWGFSPGIDFETKIIAKINAPELLRKELASPRYQCQVICLGANTDPYQPIERQYQLTRQIIEILAEHQHPLTIISKNALVERDIDLLAPLAQKNLVRVFISVTSLDAHLSRYLEPRTSAPTRRIETIRRLSEAGIPTGVMVAPIIPALNDCFLEPVLEAAQAAGARYAGYVLVRLAYELKDMFKDWLNTHYPLKANHVMSLIRQIRGGKENDTEFGRRMRGEGLFAELIAQRFKLATERLSLNQPSLQLDSSLFQRLNPHNQLSLF